MITNKTCRAAGNQKFNTSSTVTLRSMDHHIGECESDRATGNSIACVLWFLEKRFLMSQKKKNIVRVLSLPPKSCSSNPNFTCSIPWIDGAKLRTSSFFIAGSPVSGSFNCAMSRNTLFSSAASCPTTKGSRSLSSDSGTNPVFFHSHTILAE